MRSALGSCVVLLLGYVSAGWGATVYVDSGSSTNGPGTGWANAFHVIQDAVDAAVPGDTVLVTNGVYDTGGLVRHGQGYTNRVVIEKGVTVSSVNGSDSTLIVGASDNGTNGPAAVRCVWISDGTLAGFTITNGHTQVTGERGAYQCGGGVLLSAGGTVSNCVIRGCSASATGGGVDFQYGGVVVACVIEGNTASPSLNYGGGGVHLHDGALLDRCIVRDNSAPGSGADGGGLYFWSGGHARNCLVEGNTANNGGGGVYVRSTAPNALLENCTITANIGQAGGGMYLRGGTNRNCIIWGNTTTGGARSNWSVGSGNPGFEYCCLAPTNGLDSYGAVGCIDDNPRFRYDFSLQDGSPCRDAGSDGLVTGRFDLRGSARIMGPSVDIGAYEWIYHTPVAGFGGALEFDGADDCVNVPYGAGLNPTGAFTVECWVYVTGGAGTYRSPVTSRNGVGKGYTLYAGDDNDWQFWLGNGSGRSKLDSGADVVLEEWTHLAGVYDGDSNMTLYVNGEVVGTSLTGVTFVANDAMPLYIGAGKTEGTTPDFHFPGRIDEVRIWSSALSVDTIRNWMYREIDKTHPAYTSRAACYSLNDGGGTVAADVARDHDGVLSGTDGPAWVDSTAGNVWEWVSDAGMTGYGRLVGSDQNGSSTDGTDWTLTFEIVTQPTHGTAAIVADNEFSYTVAYPHGADSFTYRVRDPGGLVSGVATSWVAVLRPAPYLDITNDNMEVAREIDAITVGGVNDQWVIGTLGWTNPAAGAGASLPVSGSEFKIPGIPIVVGDNKITVTGTNGTGGVTSDSVTITRGTWHGGNSPKHYVSTVGTEIYPYTNWATAARVIQEAVDAAADHDTVLVSNGVYEVGGRVQPGYNLLNRVMVTRYLRRQRCPLSRRATAGTP